MPPETMASVFSRAKRASPVYMSKYWVDTKVMESKLKHCLGRGVVLAAAAILTGSVSGAPSASATPGEEVAGTADATVKAVQGAPNTVQSLPSAVPPATAPAPPQVPIQQPAQTSKPTPSPTGSGADVPSVKRTADTARDSVSVSSTGAETTKRAIPSAGENGDRTPAFQNPRDAGPSKAAPPVNTPSRAPPSIKPAEVAALQRWFFRIWPAIPLGGNGVDRGEAARVLMGDLLRPAAAAIARLLSLAPPITAASGDSPLGEHPGTANTPKPALPDAATGRELIYLVALVALLALLASTIWRELRAVLRPWLH